jgi:hypothetical protein
MEFFILGVVPGRARSVSSARSGPSTALVVQLSNIADRIYSTSTESSLCYAAGICPRRLIAVAVRRVPETENESRQRCVLWISLRSLADIQVKF